ncbi:MAG: hypothetical protein ACLS9R_05365 [Anaerobutyricum hallii]|nr:hypothetical protein [Anaerobutyricum hallii]
MLDIQLGRRNLTPIQKIAITEKYRPIYEKQAKENSLSNLKQNTDVVKLPTRMKKDNMGRTSEKLASIANVSEKTYRMGAKILNSGNEKLKQEVLSGEKSINAGYKELTGKKVGKRIKELERLYGIQNGSTSFQGNQYEVVTNKSEAPKKTQEQLAAQMGISVDTLQNYKLLSEMIPELSDLVDTGIFLVFILR